MEIPRETCSPSKAEVGEAEFNSRGDADRNGRDCVITIFIAEMSWSTKKILHLKTMNTRDILRQSVFSSEGLYAGTMLLKI